MSKRFIFTAEITLTIDDAGAEQTFYFSTAGFTSKGTDAPANTVFQEYLEDPGTLRRELFSGARISGPVRPSFGQLVLSNHSGVLDSWTTYGFSGGRIVVRYGEQGAAYPAAFTTVFIAYAYAPIVDFDRVRIVLRDRLEKLEEPIVNDVFQGSGRLEGTGIAKRKKQLILGQPGFVPVIPINEQRQIYYVQSNAADERCFRSTNPPLYLVFEGGRGLDFGGYYLTEDDLFDGPAPAAGFFKVYSPGVDGLTPETTESAGPLYFRLGSPPEYELRFNALGLLKVAPNELARRWRFTDLCQRAGAPVTLAAGSYVKSAGNLLIDGDQTYLDVMADACASTFSAFGFTRLDQFFTLDLQDPTEGVDSPAFEFNLSNAKDIRRQPVPGGERPVYQVAVSVGRVWPTSSLRTSLDAEEREIFERSPWQSTFTGTSLSVLNANRNGATTATVEIQGNELRDISDKLAFVRRFVYLYGARRELITLTAPLTAETMALELHNKVTLKMPRFGCEAGRPFRIITIDLNCRARTVTFGLWGGPAGPLDTVLGGGNLSPGGGTGETVIVSGAGQLGPWVNIFYGRNIGGGNGGSSSFGEWQQTFYGRVLNTPSFVAYSQQPTDENDPLDMPSHAAGDLLLLFLRADSTGATPALPSGWTNLFTGGNGSNQRRWRLCYKVDADNSQGDIAASGGARPKWVCVFRNCTMTQSELFSVDGGPAISTTTDWDSWPLTDADSIVIAGTHGAGNNFLDYDGTMEVLGDSFGGPTTGDVWAIYNRGTPAGGVWAGDTATWRVSDGGATTNTYRHLWAIELTAP